MASSLEDRVSALERQVRQLSADIDLSIAKDQELLARLRSGRSAWRAMRRMREQDEVVPLPDGDTRDELLAVTTTKSQQCFLPNIPAKQDTCTSATKPQLEGDSSALTDEAVVLGERSVSDQNKDASLHRDANSI